MSADKSESITLQPIQRFQGTVTLPGSKSISNRALLLSMLAEGTTLNQNVLQSQDVEVMLQALQRLGVGVRWKADNHEAAVDGVAGVIPAKGAELFLGNAGTAMRPLTAAMCLGQGRFVLDGVKRMRERPIQHLVDALEQLGVRIRCLHENGCPPVEIQANGLPGGVARLSGKISSQYLTALLLAAPLAQGPVRIEITDELVSKPYVQMTLNLMRRFGVSVQNDDFKVFQIDAPQTYHSPGSFFVEGDASSASYFLAGAAITGGTVTVRGFGQDSIQGDAGFVRVLEQMGALVSWDGPSVTVTGRGLRGIEIDMNTMPDVAMTLAVVALFAQGATRINNIYNWRLKETERLQAMSCELSKCGAQVEEGNDYLVVRPPKSILPATIETYDDHRMAMCFSLAACGTSPITILDPGCVGKTFPDYWEVLKRVVQFAP